MVMKIVRTGRPKKDPRLRGGDRGRNVRARGGEQLEIAVLVCGAIAIRAPKIKPREQKSSNLPGSKVATPSQCLRKNRTLSGALPGYNEGREKQTRV